MYSAAFRLFNQTNYRQKSFVKHDLKGMLKYLWGKLCTHYLPPPPVPAPTDRGRYGHELYSWNFIKGDRVQDTCLWLFSRILRNTCYDKHLSLRIHNTRRFIVFHIFYHIGIAPTPLFVPINYISKGFSYIIHN